ncbi:response regulator [Algibacter sp. 2305UL17-15]|uniref:response regulator n=1 Tax=Algibacter sp. 2305UL17-15 TaxID=3231268 RepID=UPI00345A0E85
MFTKVLVSEDMDDISKGVHASLSELRITNIHQVQYCDDAYLKIKKAILDENPYQLLITDLSFSTDHREQRFPTGEHLVKTLKKQNSNLKIIVYSVEDRLQKVRLLMKTHGIDAYVCKSRRGLTELTEAIRTVFKNENYLSPQVAQALGQKADLEITDFDIELLKQLSNGLSQDEISAYLKKRNMTPSSLSSIEKRLNKLRIQFKASNAIHLVAIVKDLGLI